MQDRNVGEESGFSPFLNLRKESFAYMSDTL